MNNESQDFSDSVVLKNCIKLCRQTIPVINQILFLVKNKLYCRFNKMGKISNLDLEKHQFLAHGLAWLATYVESLHQMLNWAEQLESNAELSEKEILILQIAFGEYLAQIRGGIHMSQCEVIRITDFGLDQDEINILNIEAVNILTTEGNADGPRRRLVNLLTFNSGLPSLANNGLEHEYELIRDQFFRYSKENIIPNAHEWHTKDELIPMSVIRDLSELGVFSLTIPEKFNGLGMTKTAMCVVSEELSRGYIGVGSLATRSEIAAELIICGGTEEQKHYWLPKIASAEILPAAVFTEPNTGSDLGSLQTRARSDNGYYSITGNKTWITHAARSNLMTLLARTDPKTTDYSGLSMFLAEKQPCTDLLDFPSEGIEGTEIEVLGYRGMREYELSFDNFKVERKNLLGHVEGKGFRQLMETFESARIQTAARAIGVAQSALDLSIQYSSDRKQFGKAIIEYPRVYGKIASMAVEIMISRQLTYFSSREKDANRRCDLQAGMAKMLSARVAWAVADNSLQIHGGNGFALEYPISRILCDARILNIFEGAAEIQAQVIARRILEQSNS
jgi:(2S)-methylsuccinyl-CoA dehydrogenase